MRLYGYTSFKFYAAACVALVGISAASTLVTDRVTLAQQPTEERAISPGTDDTVVMEILAKELGAKHPKVIEMRERLQRTRQEKDEIIARKMANEAAKEAATAKRITVKNTSGEPMAFAEVPVREDVVSEELHGNQTVVVRRSADGSMTQDVLATVPAIRGLAMLGNPKQNSQLQKALEKHNQKDASEKDKQAAKETITSILDKQFDDDMNQRVKQIAELEKKVATLKEQIEKRKEAKQRIIDLRIEVLLNESEGLGFPGGAGASGALSIAPLAVDPFAPATETRTFLRTTAPTIAPATAPSAPVAPAPPQPPAAPVPTKP